MTHRASITTGRQGGFTLMEILVAVLVLAIGLLGLAGMQVQALQYNQSAYLRSQASLLAYDIMERMRANPEAALQDDYEIDMNDSPPTPNDCTTGDCSPGQLAAYDLATWLNTASGALPEGDGSVSRSGNLFTVTIQWRDRGEDGGGGQLTTLSYQTEIRE